MYTSICWYLRVLPVLHRPNAQDREIQQAVLDLSADFNLTQVHDKPTREENLLDLVLTTNPSLIKSTNNTPGISDHDIVVVDSDTKPYYAKQKPWKCFMFSKAKWDQLKANVKEISAEIVRLDKCGSPIHHLWQIFKTDLMKAIEANIPSKMKTSNHSIPWITRDVKRALRRKARLYKKAKKSNKWGAYRQCQKECKRQLRNAEWQHINKVIDEGLQNNNTKPFWNDAKSKREDNIGIAPLKDKGHLVSDCKGKAEILANQFQSVFTKDDSQDTPEVSSRVEEDIPHLKIGEDGVTKLLRGIKINKSLVLTNFQTGFFKSVLPKYPPPSPPSSRSQWILGNYLKIGGTRMLRRSLRKGIATSQKTIVQYHSPAFYPRNLSILYAIIC